MQCGSAIQWLVNSLVRLLPVPQLNVALVAGTGRPTSTSLTGLPIQAVVTGTSRATLAS